MSLSLGGRNGIQMSFNDSGLGVQVVGWSNVNDDGVEQQRQHREHRQQSRECRQWSSGSWSLVPSTESWDDRIQK